MSPANRLLATLSLPFGVLLVAGCSSSLDMPGGGAGAEGSGAASTSTTSTNTSGSGGSTSGIGGNTTGNGGSTTGTGTGGAGGTGTGSTCTPFTDPPTTTCAPTVQCVKEGVECQCGASNSVTCSATDTGQPLGFKPPAAPPPEGGCCEEEDLVCSGYSTCGPVCRCKGGAWTCETPTCTTYECPVDVIVLEGQACDGLVGQKCSHVCSEACDCKLDPSGAAVWHCFQLPC